MLRGPETQVIAGWVLNGMEEKGCAIVEVACGFSLLR